MAENNELYSIQGSTLTDIADAIREKSGDTQQYTPSEMAAAVLAIQSGGIAELPDNLVYMEEDSEEVILQNEAVLKSGDTMTGALTLYDDPTEPLHAATKQYVDNYRPVETVLWTNLVPTNDFAAQTITLSQSIENFKFVRIYFFIEKSNQDISGIGSRDVYPGAWDCSLHGVCRTSVNGMRSGRFSSATQATFEQGFYVGDNPAAANNLCMPYKIVGVN